MPLVVVPGLVARLAGSKLVKYVIAGVTVYFAGDDIVAYVDKKAGETVEDIETQLEEEGGIAGIIEDVVGGVVGGLSNISLAFIEGLGGAVVKGVDNAYDFIREKLGLNTENVVAAVTMAGLSIFTVIYLIGAARRGTMALE